MSDVPCAWLVCHHLHPARSCCCEAELGRLGPSEAGSGAGILCLSGYLDTEGRIWCHGVTGSGAASARAAGGSRKIVFVIVNAARRVCCEGMCV